MRICSTLYPLSAESSIAQEERLAKTSPYLVTRLHLLHVIVMRLHVHKTDVVTFTLVFEQ